MELSPEERQRIYEEEKARHEAQERIRSADRPKKLMLGALGCMGAPAIGCMGVVALFGLLVFAGALLGPCAKTGGNRSFDKTELLRDVNASGTLGELVRFEVIHRVEIFDGGVAVVVGPRFFPLPFEQKRTALQVVASVVGPNRGGDHFVLYDWRTNEQVGSWSNEYGLKLKGR